MKMNDAAPQPNPDQQEVLHDHSLMRIRAHPPEIVQTQHLNLEVPTLEVKAES